MYGGGRGAGSPNVRAGVCSTGMFSTYLRKHVGAAGASDISCEGWSPQPPVTTSLAAPLDVAMGKGACQGKSDFVLKFWGAKVFLGGRCPLPPPLLRAR